jgi:hypothetical protein
MSVPVLLRRLAQAEFDDAADWYEARRAGRGAAFTLAVRQVLSAIGAQPDAHPEVHGEVREAWFQATLTPSTTGQSPGKSRSSPSSTRRAIRLSGRNASNGSRTKLGVHGQPFQGE